MVDALRRAHRMVTPTGIVVDVHPTEIPAAVWVEGRSLGDLDAADAPARHAAASAAVATAIGDGLFREMTSMEFVFTTYGDTIEELRDHVEANWRNTRIDAATVDRARAALLAAPGHTRPGIREHVRLTVLRPVVERQAPA